MNKRYTAVALGLTALCLLGNGKAVRSQDPRPGGRVLSGAVIVVKGSDIDTLARKLQEFARRLTPQEKATMDWLFQRAANAPKDNPDNIAVQQKLFSRPGTPGGLPPSVALFQALQCNGMTQVGPKQDDPKPPPPDTRFRLRF